MLPGYAGGPWHHIAVTYDGSFMRLYHNGRFLLSRAMTGSFVSSQATTNAIGFGPEGPFNGQIDEVRIWSGARTQAEIDQSRFRRLTGTEPFLMAYWRLDEGAGSVVADSSGHGWTGTLAGWTQWLPSGAPLGVPFAQSIPAVLAEPGGVVLHGLVNPDGFGTTGWFDWGTDTNYANPPVQLDLGDGSTILSVTQTLAGLAPATTYHFRMVAVNTNGTMESADKTFVRGPANKALWFGGAGDYVHLLPFNFGGGNQLTLEAWIKPEALTNSSSYDIIRQETAYYAPSYSRDWLLALYGNTVSFGLNTGLPYPNSFPVLTASAAPGRLDDGRWHHVAATYDGSTKRLFLDGVEVANASQTGSIVNSGTACAIGSMAWGAGEFFRGAIEEVRAWTTARSQAEIIQWMNQPLVGNEPGLLAYLPFNEGTGDFTADPTGHGYWGQLMGSPARVVSEALNRAVCVTLPVTNFSNLTAGLNAAANPAGLAMQVWFEWGTTTNYGQATAPQAVGSGASVLLVSQMLSGLAPGTDYHFRAVASNANEVVRSLDVAFRTSGPQVQTLPPMTSGAGSMAVRGMVNARWIPAQIWFEWGTNTSYGFSTPPQTGYGNDYGYTYSETLTNLTLGQTYHHRVMATNSGGLATGQDMPFTPSFAEVFAGTGDSWYGNSAVSWGDSDRDGDLDLLLLAGINTNIYTTLFRNDGASWTSLPGSDWLAGPGLPHVVFGTADWADFDHDGNLDLLITGDTGDHWYESPGQHVFRNAGGNSFTNAIEGLPPAGRGGGAWADYDNDGNLDFILVGSINLDVYNLQPTNVLFRGDGRGGFVNVDAGLPSVFNSAVAWGDYDNDGQPDLLIAGGTGGGLITRVYHNRNGVFTDIGAGLPGVASGSVAWGDYDGDGWLDILLAGTVSNSSNGAVCKVFRNGHDGTFSEVAAGLPGVFNGTAAWGDYDNDGQLDVLLTGAADGSGSLAARIFRNDHGSFTELAAGLSASTAGSGVWGDFDGDGRLDIAVVGTGVLSYYAGNTARIFQNLIAGTNPPPEPPSPPSGLIAVATNNGVILHWTAASDPHTPTPGLTYNVRVGTTPGGGWIVPPQSDPVTGRRRLPHIGSAEHRLFSMLTNLPVGFYYWSVQTVNNRFVGSPWAPEQPFAITSGPPAVVTLPASNVLCCSARLNGAVVPGGLATRAWFEWGTNSDIGNATPPLEVGTGMISQPVQQILPDLQPRSTYFFRLAATNSAGLVRGTNQSFTTEGPAPVVATLGSSNVLYTGAALFGTSPLSSPPADYFIEWGTTPSYGNLTLARVSDSAIGFDGVDDVLAVRWGQFPDITNNFTVELWVNPVAGRGLTAESVDGTAGIAGQRYAIFPDEGGMAYGNAAQAGSGLSIGTNGVSVIEHTDWWMPSVLVHAASITHWTHVAAVYSNHVPLLYLDGTLVRTGLVSDRIIHPSAGIGGTTNLGSGSTGYGQFQGAIQEVRVWDVPLDRTILSAWMNTGVTTNHPAYAHLRGCWPLNDGQGRMAADLSPAGNAGWLVNGASWTGGRGQTETKFGVTLSSLRAGTSYHFRAIGTNAGGTAYGDDQVFTTLALPGVRDVTLQTRPATPGALLRFRGSPGFGYVLEASTNLVDWIALTNLLAGPDGLFDFLDGNATTSPARFYRLRVP